VPGAVTRKKFSKVPRRWLHAGGFFFGGDFMDRDDAIARAAVEDATADDQLTADQLRRKRNRERKRNQRAQEKQSKKARNAGAESLDAFWRVNRESAKQSDIDALLEREAEVLDLIYVMKQIVEGTYEQNVAEEDRVPVAAIIAEVQEEKAKGVVAVEVGLLDFHLNANIFARLTQTKDQTAIFVRYGIVTALPTHRLHEWEQWLESRKPKAPSISHARTLTCLCGQSTSVSPEVARAYATSAYKCQRCFDAEQKAKSHSVEYRGPESAILDSWGRVL
jgi:hypothetical protein